jgi:para-nitrobenzyl esterase
LFNQLFPFLIAFFYFSAALNPCGMKRTYLLLSCAIFCLSFNQLSGQCENGRYYSQIFSDAVTTVPYGNAVEYNGIDTTLLVDVYQPKNDNYAHRPLIIMAFPGSFTSGVRESPDLVEICTYFSQRGYVCASIDYRLGIPVSTDSCEFLALMRGVQDMKAAVRYFYKDAQTTNQFRIDTNQIFIGGSSAGAFIALNYAYLKLDTFSFPPPTFAANDILQLGGVDGNSGNAGYSQKVKGVIDLSGGIADTVWIMPGDPMLVGEHGTEDSTVTCWFDSAYAAHNIRSSLFGGGDIKNRMSHITFNDSLYLFKGAGHVPFILPKDSSLQAILAVPSYMDTTEWLIRDFLYKNIVCDTETVESVNEVNNLSVSVFPNPSNDIVTIYSHQMQNMQVSLVTVLGQLLQTQVLPAGSNLSIRKGDLSAGLYVLEFTDQATSASIGAQKVIFY